MSIFGNIMSKIFGTKAEAATSSKTDTASLGSTESVAGGVDVGKVLGDLAEKNSQTLDWKHSIVDLMKLLGMDSSLEHRKELAKELNYTGDTSDTATMNVWLSKQVMKKLAENGGKLPDDLKHA